MRFPNRPCVMAATLLLLAAFSASPAPAAPPKAHANSAAIFAGGCFWCEEATFEGLPGVVSVVSGYTGGTRKNPTYEQVCAGGTGHLEAIKVAFDSTQITYARLLEIFWHNVDPTQDDGQFCDRGEQYRSVIFYRGAEQKKLALESKRLLETTPQRFKGKIVTRILEASAFYPAEDYHQDFYRKNPERYHEYRLGCGRDARLEELWGKPERVLAH